MLPPGRQVSQALVLLCVRGLQLDLVPRIRWRMMMMMMMMMCVTVSIWTDLRELDRAKIKDYPNQRMQLLVKQELYNRIPISSYIYMESCSLFCVHIVHKNNMHTIVCLSFNTPQALRRPLCTAYRQRQSSGRGWAPTLWPWKVREHQPPNHRIRYLHSNKSMLESGNCLKRHLTKVIHGVSSSKTVLLLSASSGSIPIAIVRASR